MNNKTTKIIIAIILGFISAIWVYTLVIISLNNNKGSVLSTTASSSYQDRLSESWYIYSLTNTERTSRGLKPLSWNTTLANSALLKACDIENRHYWSHTTPDGINFYKFMLMHGDHGFKWVGENLGQWFIYNNDPQVMMNLWMESPEHKANILKPIYTDIGIGICGKTIVEHFAEK